MLHRQILRENTIQYNDLPRYLFTEKMYPDLRRRGLQRPLTCVFICCVAIALIISRYISENTYSFFIKDFKLRHPTNASRIIFIETSRNGYIHLRQACAMESAALHHPSKTVTLYSLVELSQNKPVHQMLLAKPNIKFEVLNLTDLFRKTPMKKWHQNDLIKGSSFPVEHLSDAIRIAQLWTHGGIYMDTDVITVHPLIGLRNALALETSYGGGLANGAILVFDQHHFFLYQCMVDYVANFSGHSWAMQGPQLVTRVLKKICDMNDINGALYHPEFCQGVTILPAKAFYPIYFDQLDKFFFKEQNNKTNIADAYTVHIWNKLTKSKFAKPGTGSFLETLAKENCPSTYKLMQLLQVI